MVAYGWSSPYESDVFAIGFCGYPLACGRYGVCEYDQYCNCPPGLSLFMQINTSQPSQGCSLITPISCEHSQLHTLLETKDTTYIGQYLLNEFGEYRDLESCKKACLRNCSCKAAHFNGHYSKGYCLLLNEVLSLVTTDMGNNISVYLKLQNSSTILQSHPWILQRHAKTILGTTSASLAVVLTIIAVYLSLVRKKKVQLKDDEEFLDGVPGLPTLFSYKDLSAMTQNFSRKLGEGGFGSIFEGALFQGRKNVDWDQAEEEVHLLSVFKRKIEEDKVGEMFDMYNKDMEVQKEEGIEMMRIAGWCLQSEYTKRPSMSEVVKALQGLATVDNNLNLDYNFSNQEGETAPDATSNTILIPSILSGPR
nr:G-type lectin S-receptor-like serine/threonine-protein kinase SD2-5 [Ipomoea batatas]